MAPVRLVYNSVVIPLAHMQLIEAGGAQMVEWLNDYRPECLPREGATFADLFPHDGTENGRRLTDNELLVELAGRECYHSYGTKAGRKTNSDYIANTQAGDTPHRSVMYHAKMTFLLAGISRRLTHEIIRHYVGADRDEEGSPSQESTRYTFSPGHFVVPPRMQGRWEEQFRARVQRAYDDYLAYIDHEVQKYIAEVGSEPRGLERKRIYEAAAGLMPRQVATSMVWTSNPVALAKLFKERTAETADAEFKRLAVEWQRVCQEHWPNLFPRGV
jgi:thymidylate synthase (FAD)